MYHHWGYTSINLPLSCPLRSLVNCVCGKWKYMDVYIRNYGTWVYQQISSNIFSTLCLLRVWKKRELFKEDITEMTPPLCILPSLHQKRCVGWGGGGEQGRPPRGYTSEKNCSSLCLCVWTITPVSSILYNSIIQSDPAS